MALSDEQATRLQMVNELITSDPQAAHALASRWDAMIRREEAGRAAAAQQANPQDALFGTPAADAKASAREDHIRAEYQEEPTLDPAKGEERQQERLQEIQPEAD
jgi:hypothetical protein